MKKKAAKGRAKARRRSSVKGKGKTQRRRSAAKGKGKTQRRRSAAKGKATTTGRRSAGAAKSGSAPAPGIPPAEQPGGSSLGSMPGAPLA